ncbi:Ankyrin-3 [Pseudolycoriella hygida]|uniref:Ankyrin-3 n=1 Tax=Pseudolycoriella hygida TaxID=35572 RepID=A0A9Q0NEH2_9DIPT|nr:Ankyrin-3 [Pseudolycoriella hygida]
MSLPQFSTILQNVLQNTNRTEYSLDSMNGSRELSYQASGVKLALHGIVYQLKLLMLVLKRAFDKKQNFKLATELDDAEKFDDVVIQWEDGQQSPTMAKTVYYQFLQAKHKSDENELISVQNLFSEKDDEAFSLQKYFKSYQKLKTRFRGACIDNVIICTNINFNRDLGDITLIPHPVQPTTDSLGFFHIANGVKTTLWNRINVNTIAQDKLELFKNTSEVRILAKILADCINGRGKIDFTNSLFKKYCHALASNVFDFTKMKFRDTFFTSTGSDVVAFRKALTEILHLSENDMREKLEKIRLNEGLSVSADYMKHCVWSSVPHITNPAELAKKLIAAMKAKQNIRIERRSNIIRENISSFAGNVTEVTSSGDVKFTKAFLDPAINLRGNLDQLRLKLREEVTKCNHCRWTDLHKFTFRITDFPDIKYDSFEESFKLPFADITIHEIEEFFNKLIFATNTPNESDLSAIIGKEFQNTYGLNCAKVDDLITGSYMESVLNWMKARDAYWLTQSKAESYFLALQRKVATLQFAGISLNSLMSFRNSGIECVTDGNNFHSLDEFMADERKAILLVECENESSTWLNWLKISTALQRVCGTMLDIALYTPLSAINNLIDSLKLTLSSAGAFFVVCHCDDSFSTSGIQFFERELNARFQTSSLKQKKIIFVMDSTKYKNSLNSFIDAPYTTSISMADVCLNHLTENSKQLFLKKTVDFCGRLVQLQQILKFRRCSTFSSREILKLSRSETLQIGRKLPSPSVHYIGRTLYRSVLSMENLSSLNDTEVVAVSGVDVADIAAYDSVIHLSWSSPSLDFDRCVKSNPDKTVHWLRRVDNQKFVHVRSRGPLGCVRNLTNLLKNGGEEYRFVETEMCVDISGENVSVLCAVPGMGKSETLKKLMQTVAQRCDGSVFIIWINLIDWTNQLQNVTFDTINEVLDFIYTTQSMSAQFEKELLRCSLESSGAITFFLDGFDEMIPDYEVQICKLLRMLANTSASRIYVSTRTSSIHVLEHQLNVLPYQMDAFSVNDQIRCISSYWKTELDAQIPTDTHSKLDALAQKLIYKFNERTSCEKVNSSDSEFNGNPLQALMLAEIYFPWAVEDNSNFDEVENLKMDAYTLYKRFMEVKYSRYFTKMLNPTFPSAKKIIADLREVYDTRHELLAFQEVFPLQAPYVIDTPVPNNKWLEDFKDVMTPIGIMYYSADGNLKFVHRTFSEFLAGVFLGKEAQKASSKFKDFLTDKGLLWHPERKMIRYYFDRFLCEDTSCQCHIAVLNDDAVTVYELIEREPTTWYFALDKMGRTPIHLIASYGRRTLLNDDFRSYLDGFEICDRIYGWKPVKYAAHIEDWSFTIDILIFTTASRNQFSLKEKSGILLNATGMGILHSMFDFWPSIESDESFETILLTTDHQGENVFHKVLLGAYELTLKFLLNNMKRHPELLKRLLLTKDTSASPLFLLHTEKRNDMMKKYKENSLQVMLQGIEDILSPTDFKEVVFTTDKGNQTLVHYAAALGNVFMLRKLLQGLDEESRGNVLKRRDKTNATPIEIAMLKRNLDAAQTLYEFGSATTRLSKEELFNLLEHVQDNASSGDEYDIVSVSSAESVWNEEEVLTNIGASTMDDIKDYLTSSDNRMRTILHYAAEEGSVETDDLGRTPFHLAAQDGYSEIVEMIIMSLKPHGSELRDVLKIVDCERMSILQMATQNGHLSTISTIVSHLLEITSESGSENEKLAHLVELFTIKDSNNGYTLLHEAVTRQHQAILDVCDNDNDLNSLITSVTPTGLCALHYPSCTGNAKLLEILLNFHLDEKKKSEFINHRELEGGFTPLHLACTEKQVECVRILLRHGVDVNVASGNDDLPIHCAIRSESLEITNLLIENKADIHSKSASGQSPLDLAIIYKCPDIVRTLLEAGAGAQSIGFLGTPYYLTCKHGSLEILNILFDKLGISSCNLSVERSNRETPLHIAVKRRHSSVVQTLLSWLHKGLSVDPIDSDGFTPLCYAAANGDDAMIELFLREGADIESVNERGYSLLLLASKNVDGTMFDKLLLHGASIHQKSITGITCLHYVSSNGGNADRVRACLDRGLNIDCETNCIAMMEVDALDCLLPIQHRKLLSDPRVASTIMLKPLHIAAAWGWKDVCSELIKNGASTVSNVYPPVNAAALAETSDIELLTLLSGNEDACDIFGRTLLHWTAISGHIQNVIYVVDGINNVDKPKYFAKNDHDGRTPLHCAVAFGRTDVSCYLLLEYIDNGVDINVTDNRGHTLLHTALGECSCLNTASIHKRVHLIDALWNHNKTWTSAKTLLHSAITSWSVEILNHFINLAPSQFQEHLSSLDSSGNTPLLVGSAKGFLDGCKTILEKGTLQLDDDEFKRFINIQNFIGSTALHEAVQATNLELVKLLLYYGADPTVENDANKSPLLVAQENHSAFPNGITEAIELVLTQSVVAFESKKNK